LNSVDAAITLIGLFVRLVEPIILLWLAAAYKGCEYYCYCNCCCCTFLLLLVSWIIDCVSSDKFCGSLLSFGNLKRSSENFDGAFPDVATLKASSYAARYNRSSYSLIKLFSMGLCFTNRLEGSAFFLLVESFTDID